MGENPRKETYPLFSLSNANPFSFGSFASSEASLPPPPPCVEVLPSEVPASVKWNVEEITITEGLTLLKGRVNTRDVFGVSNSDLVPGKYEGGLKLWEGSIDLVKTLHSEIQDGRLSLQGKRVLELGCGHGLPGIFSCLEEAAVVHFQDFNAEVLRCLTIPNFKSNITREQVRPQNLHASETKRNISMEVHFFAGDWSEIHQLLFHGCDEEHHQANGTSSAMEQCNGYDVILMAETVYSLSSLPNLYRLIKKCLSCHKGVVYLAGKKHYFGVGGGTRHFVHVVKEDGVMDGSLLAEVADGSSNVREIWKFSFT